MSIEWVPLASCLLCPFRRPTTCHRSLDVWWGDSGEYGQTVGVWLQIACDHSISFIQCRVQFLGIWVSRPDTGQAYTLQLSTMHSARADDLSVVGVTRYFETLLLVSSIMCFIFYMTTFGPVWRQDAPGGCSASALGSRRSNGCWAVPLVEEADFRLRRIGAELHGLWCCTPTRAEVVSVSSIGAVLCSESKGICIHKAVRARVNRLVVRVDIEAKWCEDTSVIAICFFSLRVPRIINYCSPVECVSCTSGDSSMSCCRPSQAVSDEWLCHKQPRDLRRWFSQFQSHIFDVLGIK